MIWWWAMHLAGTDNPSGPWYLWWSGFFADLTIFAGGFVLIRRHNCHVDGCKSVVTHLDPSVHAPACRRHHSLRHKHGVDPHA